MKKIKVVYNEKQVANSGSKISPSSDKPKYMAELLKSDKEISDIIEFIEPTPVTIEDIKQCHNYKFVDGVMNLSRDNGFGTRSQSVVDSLPYTNGAMYEAAKTAIYEKIPTAALVSGFHHAGYMGFEKFGHFCTFNGLTIAAVKLIYQGFERIAIVDCDMHYGNGTDDILNRFDPQRKRCINISFGAVFKNKSHADSYLKHFEFVKIRLEHFRPSVILYQAGADVHINDPFGGVLTEEQMFERDVRMFTIAKELGIPIAWNLAGGYQVDENGRCDYVLQLHLNTFKACKKVYGLERANEKI